GEFVDHRAEVFGPWRRIRRLPPPTLEPPTRGRALATAERPLASLRRRPPSWLHDKASKRITSPASHAGQYRPGLSIRLRKVCPGFGPRLPALVGPFLCDPSGNAPKRARYMLESRTRDHRQRGSGSPALHGVHAALVYTSASAEWNQYRGIAASCNWNPFAKSAAARSQRHNRWYNSPRSNQNTELSGRSAIASPKSWCAFAH